MSSTVNKIVYGALEFTDDEIMDGEAYKVTSLLCDTLEIGTLTVTLYITDDAVGAALTGFKRNDKVQYFYRDVLRGTYYIESVQRTGRYTYSISANDGIALLEQSNHLGGIYTGQTVTEVVADICNIPYIIQSKFANIALYGWLPIATRRSNLAQVMFVIGANAKTDQNGVLRIEGLWDGVSSNIGQERIFLGDTVTYASKITEISVLEHQYIPSTEEITLFEGTTQAGDVIQFSEPAYDLVATGFTITSSGANYAVVTSGNGTLTGKKYAHTTRDVRAAVSEADVPNVVEVTEATLVSLTNSAAIADRLAKYYEQIESLGQDVIYAGEEPGDVVGFLHPYGEQTKGTVQSTIITMGGRLTANEQILIGYTPPQSSDVEYYDEFEVITADGDWTVPDGVTRLRAVLISGGTGGEAGYDGSGNTVGDFMDTTTGVSTNPRHNRYSVPALSGEGGAAGNPGSGGKVYQADIDVMPGQVIAAVIGKGGQGALIGQTETAGSAGSATTFGDLTSDDGASSADGFLELTTGVTYALPGNTGVAGGRGSGYQDSSGESPPVDGPTITVDGVEYKPGTQGAELNDEQTNYEAMAEGGYGGGAAYKANGGNGGDGIEADTSSSGDIYVEPGVGGAGADALAPPKKANYGSGGDGGNGGGGGGGGGLGRATARGDDYTFHNERSRGGPGGKGSAGGEGADGCIFLYYQRPESVDSGALVSSDGKYLLDSLGRYIVV